ncbi:hypothetical protein T439DRAFT_243469 [Meredithblackwellia eburnea MCA 4105]
MGTTVDAKADLFPLFHLSPLAFDITNPGKLTAAQLALAAFSSEYDESLEKKITRAWRQKREKARNRIGKEELGIFRERGTDDPNELWPAFELIDLAFEVSEDNLESLTSAQLAVIQFHPDGNKELCSEAEDVFFIRREKDFAAGLSLPSPGTQTLRQTHEATVIPSTSHTTTSMPNPPPELTSPNHLPDGPDRKGLKIEVGEATSSGSPSSASITRISMGDFTKRKRVAAFAEEEAERLRLEKVREEAEREEEELRAKEREEEEARRKEEREKEQEKEREAQRIREEEEKSERGEKDGRAERGRRKRKRMGRGGRVRRRTVAPLPTVFARKRATKHRFRDSETPMLQSKKRLHFDNPSKELVRAPPTRCGRHAHPANPIVANVCNLHRFLYDNALLHPRGKKLLLFHPKMPFSPLCPCPAVRREIMAI